MARLSVDSLDCITKQLIARQGKHCVSLWDEAKLAKGFLVNAARTHSAAARTRHDHPRIILVERFRERTHES
jgi:hypothetical protein